jgi:hypothetical protein
MAATTEMDMLEYKRRQKLRSIAIGFGLAALVLIFYVATIVRLGPNALRKDGMGKPAATSPLKSNPVQPAADAACKKAGTC